MSSESEINIGDNIRRIRKARGLGQEALADALGVSVPTISKLEKNERQLKGREIPILYEVLGCDATDLFGEGVPPLMLERVIHPSLGLLGKGKSEPEIHRILLRLERQSRNQIELESGLGCITSDTLFKRRFQGPRNFRELDTQAGALASEVRRRWDLGGDPIHNLEDILEQHSVIWSRWRLPGQFSGLSAGYGERAVILLNVSEAGNRQKFSLAHELCHVLIDAADGVVLTRKHLGRDARGKYPDMERRADLFAGKLLMPFESAQELAHRKGFKLEDIQSFGVTQLAYHFGMSVAAVLRTLRYYGVISWSRVDALESQRSPLRLKAAREIHPVDAWSEKVATEIESLPRLVRLGFRAYMDKSINETALAELLDINRTRLTKLVREYKSMTASKGN